VAVAWTPSERYSRRRSRSAQLRAEHVTEVCGKSYGIQQDDAKRNIARLSNVRLGCINSDHSVIELLCLTVLQTVDPYIRISKRALSVAKQRGNVRLHSS